MTFSPVKRDLVVLLAICAACFFWRLGSVGLFDLNEGLYTEAAREVVLRGDYVTPRVNGVPFFDKPPLAIWCAALSFRVLGVSEFAARLPVAAAATLLVVLTWWFGKRCFGRRAGLLAGAMLAVSPLYFGTARQMTMDIHQSWWFGAAMVCFYLGYAAPPGRGKRWYYGFWASCALAFLAKSIPGLIPIACALVYVVLDNRFAVRPILRGIWEARPIEGLLLLLALAGPWFVLAYRANGRLFYEQFWVLHHLKLASGAEFSHVAPAWYYVPALLVGFFPFSLFIPCALRADPPGEGGPEGASARRFVTVWAVVPFLLFSLMVSKLVSYLLPIYPAAALLVGTWLDRAARERRSWPLRAGAALLASMAVAALVGATLYVRATAASPRAADMYQAVPPPVIAFAFAALGVVAAGMALVAGLAWTDRNRGAVIALVGTMVALTILCVRVGLAAMGRTIAAPLHDLAAEAGRREQPGMPLAIHIGRPIRPSVFFYLPGRLFTGKPQAGPFGDSSILAEGEKGPIDAFLQRTRPAYVLTDSKRAEALFATTRGLSVVRQRDRWVLLRADRLDASSRDVARPGAHLPPAAAPLEHPGLGAPRPERNL